MSRRADLIPKRHIHTTIDPQLGGKLELHLFSELEGRVPQGAYQNFITRLIQQYFEDKEIDLAPYTGALPGFQKVRGSEAAIKVLTRLLENGGLV